MAVRAAVSLKKEKTRAMEVKNWEACSKHIAWFHCDAEEACLCPRCDMAVHSSNCASAKHVPRELTLNDDKNSACTSSEKLVFQSFAGATEVMTCAPFDSCRRPRTSWGRPHSEYSSLLNRSFHRAGIFLPSLNLHRHLKENKLPSFLADMDLPLHDMPKFTDADEDEDEYDYCLKFAPPFHTDDDSKLTPYSHSPPLSSCSTVGFTPNKFTSTVLTEDCTVDGLWTDGLIDLQRDLQQILGENRVSLYPVKAEQESENIYPPRNKSVIASRTTSTSSDGCSTAEEDYTINLSDFEPDENMTHFEGDLIDVKPEFDQVFPNRLYLNLDFDAVLTGWSSRDSPWIGGSRPDEGLVLQYLENAWMPVTDCSYVPYSSWPVVNVNAFPINEIPSAVNFQNWGKKLNREAKVLRFRERRRNRLFSKTIRYEVRKLNAEKRPRMKGRFIKRMHGALD